MYKQLLAKFSIVLVLTFGLLGVAASVASPTAEACGRKAGDELLGVIPPWHHYLPCSNGGINTDALIDRPELLWLIALAIFEMIVALAAIASVIFIIWAGAKFISSQGKPEATSAALKTLYNAITGLIIAVSAATLVNLFVNLLAGNNLNTNELNIPEVQPTTAGLQNILVFIYALMGLIAVIFIVLGGMRFITSTGDPGKAASARQTIIYAVVGLIVVLVANVITGVVIDRLTTAYILTTTGGFV